MLIFRSKLTNDRIQQIVQLIPGEWLADDSTFESVEQHRDVYFQFLTKRLAHSAIFVKEAQHAGKSLI